MLKKIVPLISSLLGIVICSEVEVLLAEDSNVTKMMFTNLQGKVKDIIFCEALDIIAIC